MDFGILRKAYRAEDMFYSHFNRFIQVLADCLKTFSVHLGGTFIRHQPYFWLNVDLMPFCHFCVDSLFFISLLALRFLKYLVNIWNINCFRISHRSLDAHFKFQASLPSLLGNNTNAFDTFESNSHLQFYHTLHMICLNFLSK